MTEHEASRTLVKSPPELWAELSDESSLGRHFDQFGEIRITGLEPETAVAWEGERVSGTVRLEPSGWGTRVVLTARAAGQLPGPSAHGAAPPAPQPPPLGPSRRGFMARLRAWLSGQRVTAAGAGQAADFERAPEAAWEPASEAGSEPESESASESLSGAAEILTAALDSLGRAHHRPYSRA
jgi:hypothetical protein